MLVLGVKRPFSGRLGVQRRRVALPLVPLTPAVPQSTRNLKGGSREPADGPRVHSQGAPRPLFSAPEPPNRTAGPPHTPGSRLRQKSAPGDRTMPRRAVTVARRQEHPPLLRGSDRAHSTGGGSWCCNRPARPAEAPTARTTSAPTTPSRPSPGKHPTEPQRHSPPSVRVSHDGTAARQAVRAIPGTHLYLEHQPRREAALSFSARQRPRPRRTPRAGDCVSCDVRPACAYTASSGRVGGTRHGG